MKFSVVQADIKDQAVDCLVVDWFECKKALVEANGDMELAIENMRKSGLAKADNQRRLGRIEKPFPVHRQRRHIGRKIAVEPARKPHELSQGRLRVYRLDDDWHCARLLENHGRGGTSLGFARDVGRGSPAVYSPERH